MDYTVLLVSIILNFGKTIAQPQSCELIKSPTEFLWHCVPTNSPSRILLISKIQSLLNTWSFGHSDACQAITFVKGKQLRRNPLSF